MTVMKLGRLSEEIGHDVVSVVEFLEDGMFEFHKQRSRVDFVRGGTGSEQAEFVFEVAQLGQGVLPAALLFGRRATWGEGGRRWRARRLGTETKAADVEVFLKAVRLEEIGEFEGSDVAALGADLALKVDDDGAHLLERVDPAQQFIPHPFPVKAQGQALAGQLAIELVGLADGGGIDRERSWRRCLGHNPWG